MPPSPKNPIKLTSMGYKWKTIESINITVARKLAKYAFGVDNVFKVVQNMENRTFDIYLTDRPDDETLTYFKDFWGTGYRIIKTNPEQLDAFEEVPEEQESTD